MRATMVGWLAFVAIVTAWIGPAAAQAAAGKRVALVIGVGGYKDPLLGQLVHPQSDADAVALKLRDLGFTVVEDVNPANCGAHCAERPFSTGSRPLMLRMKFVGISPTAVELQRRRPY